MKPRIPSFPWIKKVAAKLAETNDAPLFGNAPAFQWERLSSLISSRFTIHDLQINEIKRHTLSSADLKKEIPIGVQVSPIGPGVFWLMTEKESRKLSTQLLKGKAKGPLLNADFADGFYRYLLLQAVDFLHTIEPFQHVSFELDLDAALPETDLIAIDLEILIDGRSSFARIAIDEHFHHQWIQHFAKNPTSFPASTLSMEIPVSIRIGTVELSIEEWQQIAIGDAIVLGSSVFDSKKQSGLALLEWQDIPLFNAKIKHHKIELVDPAATYEIQKSQHPEETMFLSVELATIQMSLEKLMQLQPGHTLESPVNPDGSISLTLNGEILAKGELVHLGEIPSFRVLSL